MSGRSPVKGSGLILGPEPDNFPPYGSVLAKLRRLKSVPEFVHIPDMMSNNPGGGRGQRASDVNTDAA